MIDKRKQRIHYLLTICNDIKMKEYPSNPHPKNFDQIGGGIKLFKDKWVSSFWLRLSFNLVLPLAMVCYDVLILCRYSLVLLFHTPKNIHPKRVFVSGHNRLYNVGVYSGLIDSNSVWFSTPFETQKLPEPHIVLTVFDYLHFRDILQCMNQSILCRWISVKKYGFRTFFLTQKAFSWMVTDTALRKVPYDVELLFANNADRMAMLIDFLPQKEKSLVQHGTLHFYHRTGEDPRFSYHKELGFWTWNCLYRFKTLTRMYCYSEKDKNAYKISNFLCHPEFIVIGYGFKPSYKPDKPSVLIIANPQVFLDKEELILKSLQGLNIDIFLKNHPALSDSYYDFFQKKYDFIFLSGKTKELPAVDVVFSYDSTLAYEYESIGAEVLYYYTFNWNKIREIVIKKLNHSCHRNKLPIV